MGAYLSTPNLEKESEAGTQLGHAYGVSSMQGWRRSQEDAHLATVVPGMADTAVYGVFDGHCGREVSNFAVSRFARVLKELPVFSDDLASAMAPAFHRIDALLDDTENAEEIKALKAKPKGQGGGAAESSGDDGDDGSSGGGSGGGGDSGNKIKVEDAVDMFQKMCAVQGPAP